LARLQTLLETNAPIVASALQPGLTDAQIAALESQGGFRLSEDIRALYRWHNGIAKTSTIGLLAGERFVPLDEVVQERSIVRQQVASRSGVQRAAFFRFSRDTGRTGFRFWTMAEATVTFYDPMRTDAEGAFFYYFGEIGHYLWFPSVRNFLAGVIECYESRAVRIGSDGKSLEEDFDRTQKSMGAICQEQGLVRTRAPRASANPACALRLPPWRPSGSRMLWRSSE